MTVARRLPGMRHHLALPVLQRRRHHRRRLATSVAPVPSSSPIATMPELPACRYADEPAGPRGLRRLAAHDRRYDEPTAEGLRAAGPRGGFAGRSVRRWLHSAHRDRRISRPSPRPGGRPGCDSRSSRPTGARPGSKADVRGLGTHLRRSRGQTFQCARRTLGAPARDRHRFQGRGRRVPVDARHSRARGMRRWLAAERLAASAGIQSYPPGAETQTCYGAEAWHYRYVGRDVAAEVHASGMTLRAWLWLHASAATIPRTERADGRGPSSTDGSATPLPCGVRAGRRRPLGTHGRDGGGRSRRRGGAV